MTSVRVRPGGGAVDPLRTRRSITALVALLSSAGCVAASALTWLSLPDGVGGSTAISGWGAISGGSQIAGENLNDALNGLATFRPGMLAVVVGGLGLLAAIGIAAVARGDKRHRVPAAVLALAGLTGLAWGIVRGLAPDSVQLLGPGENGGSGTGPWLTAGCSALLLATAVVIFIGRLDPPTRPARR